MHCVTVEALSFDEVARDIRVCPLLSTVRGRVVQQQHDYYCYCYYCYSFQYYCYHDDHYHYWYWC